MLARKMINIILVISFMLVYEYGNLPANGYAAEDFQPSLKRVASMRLSNVTFDLSVSGNYAYVTGVGSSGDDNIAAYLLEIYDISNPTQSKKVGEISMPEPIGFGWAIGIAKPGVYVKDSCAYMTSLAGGLYIIDVKDPKIPKIAGNIKTQTLTGGVHVMNQYAYLLGRNNLQIVDVKEPRNPKIIGSVDLPEEPRGIYVMGDYAYVSAGWDGLQVIDIKDPQNPKIIGSAEYPGIAKSSYVMGKYAYVAGEKGTAQRDDKGRVRSWNISGGRFQVVDISDPKNPKNVGGVEPVVPNYLNKLYDVYVSGNHAYVVGSDLQIIDISDPQNPKVTANANIRTFIAEQQTAGVQIKGNYAYVTDGLGIQVIDISNPQQPKAVGGVHGYTALGVQVIGNYAYVTDMFNTLVVIDISDPKNPKIVGNANISSLSVQGAIDIYVKEKYAYLVDRQNGLRIIDVGQPTQPKIIGNLQLPGIENVHFAGDYAYITTGQSLQVIDIKDPKNLKIVGKLEIPARHIYVSGENAYVSVSSGPWVDELHVIDIKDPKNPKVVSKINLSKNENIGGLYVVESYAYVGVRGRGKIHVIDISDPKNLKVVSTIDTASVSYIHVTDKLAFIGGKAELQMIDISDPQSPKVVSSGGTFGPFIGIFGYINDLYYANGYVYVAGFYHLDIFQVGGAIDIEPQSKEIKQGALLQNYSNPFNSETWIPYLLAEPTEVKIQIYNVTGQLVRTLQIGRQGSGEYTSKAKAAYWDGKNEAGEHVASGIYFYRIKAGNLSVMRKLVVSKLSSS